MLQEQSEGAGCGKGAEIVPYRDTIRITRLTTDSLCVLEVRQSYRYPHQAVHCLLPLKSVFTDLCATLSNTSILELCSYSSLAVPWVMVFAPISTLGVLKQMMMVSLVLYSYTYCKQISWRSMGILIQVELTMSSKLILPVYLSRTDVDTPDSLDDLPPHSHSKSLMSFCALLLPNHGSLQPRNRPRIVLQAHSHLTLYNRDGIALESPLLIDQDQLNPSSTRLHSHSLPRRAPSPFDFNSLPTAPDSVYSCQPPSPFDFDSMADTTDRALVSKLSITQE